MESIQIKICELNKVIVDSKQCQCDCIEENMQNQRNCMTVEANYPNNYSKGDAVNSSYNFLCVCKTKCEETCKEHNMHYPIEIHKIHRLTPINEQNEDSLTDLCYHGCKNGCSATVPTPQEVSENVFKENWLQKLEDIKQKETVLRNKEITLQNREKALFKKEREIKILECLWKHKLKQLDLYFKENKHVQYSPKEYSVQKDTLESVSIDPNEIHKEESCDDCTEKVDNSDVNKQNFCIQTIPTQNVLCNQTEQLDKHADNIGIMYQERTSTSSSSCSPVNNVPVAKKVKTRSSLRNSITAKSSYSKSTYNSNNRTKRPSKIDYSDLDTTLSADVGDSSFVQTSQKFNPEVYKKPYMFTRSASERHVKHTNNKSNPSFESQNSNNSDERPETLGIEQDKVLERVTKNIVASRDKSTKFQHYGYMDQNINFTNRMCKIENEKRYSYLDLETGSKLCSCQKLNKDFKDRPISWNEETNEWLQKKRKAYNMMMKQAHTENKENFECNTKVNSKSEKMLKKKDIKNRILTIFR